MCANELDAFLVERIRSRRRGRGVNNQIYQNNHKPKYQKLCVLCCQRIVWRERRVLLASRKNWRCGCDEHSPERAPQPLAPR